MAGILLRAVKSARPGDFITVAELTGRITEMDLLHTEVQSEFRDRQRLALGIIPT